MTPSTDFFPETLPQSTLNFTPERDRYGQVDIDALVDALPTLRVAQQVAKRQHFFHWELEFADQFKARKGFNLVLGNPPWERIKLQEKEFFAARQPAVATAMNASEREKLIAGLAVGLPWERDVRSCSSAITCPRFCVSVPQPS